MYACHGEANVGSERINVSELDVTVLAVIWPSMHRLYLGVIWLCLT